MKTLSDYDVPGLQRDLQSAGIKPVHAVKIVREFLAGKGTLDRSQFPPSKRLGAFLDGVAARRSNVRSRHRSADGTVKLLLGMDGGGAVESVLMPGFRDDRASGCISSQIGCAMGCDFCASTKGGLERNLERGEIVEQFLHLKAEAHAAGRRLMTIVFMGMGEPMQNLDNVIGAIRLIAEPKLGGLGWRHVTVSTVGIVPGIDALADADLGVHVALSLHAADDETRSKIVPMNRRYPIAEIIAATKRFAHRSGRIPTIEWCMLAGVNDSDEQAEKLAALVQDLRAHVNLIPYNSIGLSIRGLEYRKPAQERLVRFLTILRERNVVAHFRHTRGDDVNAACGQLRQAMV
jgi:23S rRNA (adenine2503-C2)-methyltransferase